MDRLPDELITDILEYLQPSDLAALQKVSRRLLRLGRDNSLWRFKCYYGAPSTARKVTPSSVLRAILSQRNASSSSPRGNGARPRHDASHGFVPDPLNNRNRSEEAKAIADWDCTHASEKIDWYSEYVARHASLSVTWLDHEATNSSEVRGLCFMGDEQKALGPLEDGSVCIWDISDRSHGHRNFRELARCSLSSLFANYAMTGEPWNKARGLSFSGVGECVSVDSVRQRAYVAVADMLNEIDLASFRVVSQSKYVWPITALSQENLSDQPLTVGTTLSLYLHDPRLQNRDQSRSHSPEDSTRVWSKNPEESVAFLPDYFKDGYSVPRPQFHGNYSFSTSPSPASNIFKVSFDESPLRTRRSSKRSDLSVYAQCEPGPLSILHQGQASIFIAGRFPSILSYDRRCFPRLEYAIHSGARLSSLASLPHPPRGSVHAEASLLACGEYSGRGSLEVYSLPYVKGNLNPDPNALERQPLDTINGINDPHNYRNRQTASSAKLLSVATHGTRIVFSDAEGGLKWVERDGSSLVRKWNINDYSLQDEELPGWHISLQARTRGEQVVRKIIPLTPAAESANNGTRGDADLLVWTGEKAGIVSLQPRHQNDEMSELDESFGTSSLIEPSETEDRAVEYGRIMRTAFERQTDEINWMRRFGMAP